MWSPFVFGADRLRWTVQEGVCNTPGRNAGVADAVFARDHTFISAP